MSDPILRVDGISKGFPGVQALKGVHLEVHAGEVLVLNGDVPLLDAAGVVEEYT